MIEQIPLTLVVDDAMMIGPAAVLMLGHDETFVFVGAHRILTHGIAENLSILAYVRISKVIPAISLESERTFSLTAGQVFQTADTQHFKLAVAPLYLFLGRIVSEFLHVGLEFGTTAIAPENVGVAVGSLEHTGIDAIDALDRFWFTDERSLGTVGDSYTDTKTTAVFRSRGEIEIVLPVALDTVRCPH